MALFPVTLSDPGPNYLKQPHSR